ncbi:keratin, type I cuticular Ha4-like [Bufo bufo]|uniref:keratin, type I cuticular Ha4-like n=1 Tax=Bufo bufo TaxID=8384 RepID=UPI001ABDDB86|nr:keratin, type I cuticular Ha4-like [Bufo bufo]
MGYRVFQPFSGTKTGGEYMNYPKYRTHHSSDGDQHFSQPQKMNILSNGAHYRAHNVQGTFRNCKHSSSGFGQKMGSNYAVYRCHMSNFGNCNTSKNNDLLNLDEKKTMQSLNGRLVSYLEDVKSLEGENVLLENKICEWHEENEALVFPDCSQYFSTITDLQNQVLTAGAHNGNLIKKIEDGQITADGYRKNYEMELMMRAKAEEALCNHYRLLENIHMESHVLDTHIEYLEEELLQIKKISEEEITSLQAQLGTRVNVEVETAPSIDLNTALSEIRTEYETLMESNLNDVEFFFQEMTSRLSLEVSSGIEQLQLSNNEVTELKLCVHTLETELKKQLSMITAYESTLTEIHEQYGSYLSQLQDLINMNESQMAEIQSKLVELNYECNVYMEINSSLEKEIDAYKYLLEGHDTLNSPLEITEVNGQFWCESDEDKSEKISYE